MRINYWCLGAVLSALFLCNTAFGYRVILDTSASLTDDMMATNLWPEVRQGIDGYWLLTGQTEMTDMDREEWGALCGRNKMTFSEFPLDEAARDLTISGGTVRPRGPDAFCVAAGLPEPTMVMVYEEGQALVTLSSYEITMFAESFHRTGHEMTALTRHYKDDNGSKSAVQQALAVGDGITFEFSVPSWPSLIDQIAECVEYSITVAHKPIYLLIPPTGGENIQMLSGMQTFFNELKLRIGSELMASDLLYFVPAGYTYEKKYVEMVPERDGAGNLANTITGCALYLLEQRKEHDLSWEFDMAGDFEGWQVVNCNNAEVADGLLRGNASSGDLQLRKENVYFSGNGNPGVLASVSLPGPGPVELFWGNEDGGYSPSRRMTLQYTGHGGLQTLFFDLSNHPEWTGHMIDALRIDPGNQFGDRFRISWITVSHGDFDRDLIPDAIEGVWDSDSDGLLDIEDADSDNDSMDDALEWLNLNRNPYSAADMRFTFDQYADVEGWYGHNLSGLAASNGVLRGSAVSGDPQLRRENLFVDGNVVNELYVQYKASEAGPVQLFWKNESNQWTGGLIANYAQVGQDVILYYSLSNHVEWAGHSIHTLRIDPGNQAGATFDISTIALSDGDADADGLSDLNETFADLDYDKVWNLHDWDSDGDGLNDYAEIAATRNPYDAADLHFGFNANGDSEGWLPYRLLNVAVSGGVYSGSVGAANPQLIRRCNFRGDDVANVVMDVKMTEEGSIKLLYWNETGRVASQVRSYSTPGSWQTVTFNLAGWASWDGHSIETLRVDFSVSGGTVSVGRISGFRDEDGDGINDAYESFFLTP